MLAAASAVKPSDCNPVAHATLVNRHEVDDVRRLDCRRYNACLDYAAAKDWPGFACTQCSVMDPIGEEERATQAAGALRLIRTAEAHGLA